MKLKIVIMGAGAVGCYYGAMLAKAGHLVTLVGRAHHVDAVNSRGLILERASATESVTLEATTEPGALAGADIVLVCVKSADTGLVGEEMRPFLRPGTSILSLQNGVENAQRLRSVLDRPVIPVAVYVAAEMAAPGHVRHHGRGDLVIGDGPSSSFIADTFCAAGIPTLVSANVAGELWTKLILNCAINAISAITQMPYGRMMATDGVEDVLRGIVDECTAVAAHFGVELPDDIVTRAIQIGTSMPRQTSSTAQDIARGKTTEIDHLNGYILREGETAGLPMPVNRLLVYLVKLLEPG